MILRLLTRIFGNKNERELKQIRPIVETVNSFELKMHSMTNEQLMKQTMLFRSRIDMGENLDNILPEAFATVRESALRVLGMRHYDVQILGGIVLHMGHIAEMKTGEGKTLVATLPAYLNAITGHGVHIVTVNDYLAIRDSSWMGELYNFLGMTIGTLKQGADDKAKKVAYEADITYGTNNEFGFDYLRDNMKFDINSLVQKNLNFAIVDEVDSILIDESRTPLIISGPFQKLTNLYQKINSLIIKLNSSADYSIDEKEHSISLTDKGISNVEKILGIQNIYDHAHINVLHHINQALKAHKLFKRDVDYIVKNEEVVIVDEFTGRIMPGRRYGEGLHQALEAKEKVKVNNENQTLATITFQNYFRMYNKLAGMTGTANTEAEEFKKIYNLNLNVIPTNKPMIREDMPDVIYKNQDKKFKAIIQEIKLHNKKGQPILVGTVSIENSERLSRELKKHHIKHFVLNAKNHGTEAEIISRAGQKKAVTISTNMAGRGTDIVLGEGVAEIGGLYVIGTERHESRRIDNQLRGRSGRQGDPGRSRFFLSLEDDLLRIFGGDKITSIMERLGMSDDDSIEHKLVSRSIENAQSKVESRNFDIRKHLLEYDDALNQQRKIIYKQRRDLLFGEKLDKIIEEVILDKANNIADKYFRILLTSTESCNWQTLSSIVHQQFGFEIKEPNGHDINKLNREKLSKLIFYEVKKYYKKKELIIGPNNLRHLECIVMLQLIDKLWKEHLSNMDHLKDGIGLRGYAQQNPLLVYKKEAFNMFKDMLTSIRSETVDLLFRVDINSFENMPDFMEVNKNKDKLIFSSNNYKNSSVKSVEHGKIKIGRNSPCSCGSGRKYKKCCGQ